MKRKFYQLSNKSFEKLGVNNLKELWKKVQDDGYNALSLECFTILKAVDGSENKFHAVFSTAKEDRHGDVVEQKWDLKNFKNNPVYLDSHNYNSIEHIIGKIENAKVKDGKLQGDIVYALDSEKGMLAYKLTKGGFLNTSSVGFVPLEFDEKDYSKILNSELLEISAVSVPANPEALMEKIYDKSKSIKDNKDEEDDEAGDLGESDNGKGAGGEEDEKNKGSAGKQGDEKDKIQKKGELGEGWSENNETISYQMRDIAEFDEGSFANVTIKADMPKIKAVIATPKGDTVKKIQTLSFIKDDGWSIDDAKKYYSEHQYKLENWTNAIEEKKVKKSIQLRALESLSAEQKESEEKRIKLLKIIARAADGLANNKVETRSSIGVAKEKSLLVDALRKLYKEKKNINK